MAGTMLPPFGIVFRPAGPPSLGESARWLPWKQGSRGQRRIRTSNPPGFYVLRGRAECRWSRRPWRRVSMEPRPGSYISPVFCNHFVGHIGRIAKGRGATRTAVGAIAATTSPCPGHVVRAGTRMPRCIVLPATCLHDQNSNFCRGHGACSVGRVDPLIRYAS
jgi:hypothetical protein